MRDALRKERLLVQTQGTAGSCVIVDISQRQMVLEILNDAGIRFDSYDGDLQMSGEDATTSFDIDPRDAEAAQAALDAVE